MERAITGYHCDDEDDWVAELSCGHGQHIRHRPPFHLREWVLGAEGRSKRLGTPLDCPLGDRAELPEGLTYVRSSPEWDERTMPANLQRAHRIAGGTWGTIIVRQGQLRFAATTMPRLEVVLDPDSAQAIPPEVEHEVHPLGPVRFSIDFLSVPRATLATKSNDPANVRRAGIKTSSVSDEGGETACFAHLLCPECGAILDGQSHVKDCRAGTAW